MPLSSSVMDTVSDILDAIRMLPRPEKVRLAQELSRELDGEPKPLSDERVPSDPRLELRSGFYVFTGPVGPDAADHRKLRDERADHIA